MNGNDGGKLYRIKTNGAGRQKLNDDQFYWINVAGDWVYYKNSTDGQKLYRIKTDGSGRQNLNIRGDMNAVEDWVYYSDWNNYKLYRMKFDGSGKQKLCDDDAYGINVAGDWVYYYNHDRDLYRIKTDGTGRELVE